ncbi:hypothetical protein UlMin_045063 [Ulmus minor]
MACFIPFNNRNLDISLFAFRPTVVLLGDLLDALKHFSLCTESLGCVQSSLIQSIHGNMIIWYGAWLKKSSENKESLTATLLSMLSKISSMAILFEHRFFDAYGGESRERSSAAKFCTGDTICMCIAALTKGDEMNDDLSYACLALFKSNFLKMKGVTSGVCLKCQNEPKVACIYVWKSLQLCYSWILSTNHRSSILPYLERFPLDVKYDIFRVVYVSGDNVLNFGFFSPPQMLEKGGESKGQGQIMQN